jgi:RNA polymerase sigma-70 factor (ECF subfamily)
MDDRAVIKLIQGGDVDAFGSLVRKYHENLLSFIYRLVRDKHLAEDIGQDVLLDIYKSLPTFNPDLGTPFSAWLYIAARNRCISELRKSGKRESVPVDECEHLLATHATAEDALLDSERHDALTASLAQLPEPFRSTIVFSLRGQTLDDIASRCGIPKATVKTRIFRAKEQLKLLVIDYFGGVGHAGKV